MSAARRSPPPCVPSQRAASRSSARRAERGSLTQRNARSGRVCASCGDERLTEIDMTLTDGTPVQFASCHHCEAKSWRAADATRPLDLSFDTVLERTRKIR